MAYTSMLAGLVWLVCVAAGLAGSARAAPFAYITHGGGRYVSVIDTATNAEVAQVPTRGGGFGIALNALGTRAYVASKGTNSIWVVDTVRNAVLAEVPAGLEPLGAALNPAGTQLFFTNKNSLAILDVATNKLAKSIFVGNDPYGVAVNATGTRVYVAASGANQIAVVDPTGPTLLKVIATGSGSNPIGVALDTPRNRLYVANSANGMVTVVDTDTNAIVKNIPAGAGINGVAVNSTGTRVYAADGAGRVTVIDTSSNAVIDSVQIGGMPVGIAVDATGTYCYVVDNANNRIVVVDTATNRIVKSIAVGQGPIAFGQFIGPAPAQAVEYLHTGFGHYFVTASADEIGKLDSGAFAGWVRTGEAFNVYPLATGSVPDVCRFFTEKFAPTSSHFYTPFATECAAVKTNADWTYEGLVFGADVPDVAGTCRAGTVPVYRVYNDGRSGAPNHRYTTDLAIRSAMLAQGWRPEGVGANSVIACVPI